MRYIEFCNFSYDKTGNWITKICYEYGNETPVHFFKREITYYE